MESNNCPNKQPLDCLTSETKRWIIGGVVSGLIISIVTLSNLSAKTDRVVKIEDKVDKIYDYIIAKKEK